MATSDKSSVDKLDELLRETKAGNRMATWQLVAILVSAVPGVAAAISQSASGVIILAFIVPIALVVAIFFAYNSGSGSSRSGQWVTWIVARERLRLLDKSVKKEFGTGAYHDIYVSSLRMHYQFALVEGKKDLAEYLKQELEKEKPSAPSKG